MLLSDKLLKDIVVDLTLLITTWGVINSININIDNFFINKYYLPSYHLNLVGLGISNL